MPPGSPQRTPVSAWEAERSREAPVWSPVLLPSLAGYFAVPLLRIAYRLAFVALVVGVAG